MKLTTLDGEFIEETEVFPTNTNFTGIVEYTSKSKQYYQNGKRHRLNGPAVEYADGSCLWYVEGKRHRVEGPAADYKNGSKYYFVNDEMIFKWKTLEDYEKVYSRKAD